MKNKNLCFFKDPKTALFRKFESHYEKTKEYLNARRPFEETVLKLAIQEINLIHFVKWKILDKKG